MLIPGLKLFHQEPSPSTLKVMSRLQRHQLTSTGNTGSVQDPTCLCEVSHNDIKLPFVAFYPNPSPTEPTKMPLEPGLEILVDRSLGGSGKCCPRTTFELLLQN